MRRLLFFGTGAAIIGILFLCIAFYESYLIVSTVQRQLNQSAVDTTRLLEDAALEAIFLGIMAGIGYALISLGLDGIRRQELLEAEGSAEVIFGRTQAPARKDSPRYVARPIPGRVLPPVKREAVSSLHPGIKQQRVAQPSGAPQRTNLRPPPNSSPETMKTGEPSPPPSVQRSAQANVVAVPPSSVKAEAIAKDTSEPQTEETGLADSTSEDEGGNT